MYNVYLICAELGEEKLYKIGFTKREVYKRVKELRTGNPADFKIINVFSSIWGTKIESALHRRFAFKKINREWFNLSEEDVVSFMESCDLLHNNFDTIYKHSTYYKEKGKF